MQKAGVIIYGDSLMKGTVIDSAKRYHASIAEYTKKIESAYGLQIENRSRFGITSEKGKTLLENDLAAGITGAYTLVAFGGNDCNFRWGEVAARPEAEHLPLTPLERFIDSVQEMIKKIKVAGSTPVLMTLPPIDAERYLDFVSQGNENKRNILRWLGDAQMIYRFHEMYSHAIAEIAKKTNTLLADGRKRFLDKRNFKSLIGLDGIHLAPEGYCELFGFFNEFIGAVRSARELREAAPV